MTERSPPKMWAQRILLGTIFTIAISDYKKNTNLKRTRSSVMFLGIGSQSVCINDNLLVFIVVSHIFWDKKNALTLTKRTFIKTFLSNLTIFDWRCFKSLVLTQWVVIHNTFNDEIIQTQTTCWYVERRDIAISVGIKGQTIRILIFRCDP